MLSASVQEYSKQAATSAVAVAVDAPDAWSWLRRVGGSLRGKNTNMMIARNLNGLGLIPSWQFNPDGAINPKVVNLDFPPDMYQTTVQPVGPYMNAGGGLGSPWSAPGMRVYEVPNAGRCPAGTVETSRGCMAQGQALSGIDTFIAANRGWFAIGGFFVIGAGLIVALTALLNK